MIRTCPLVLNDLKGLTIHADKIHALRQVGNINGFILYRYRPDEPARKVGDPDSGRLFQAPDGECAIDRIGMNANCAVLAGLKGRH